MSRIKIILLVLIIAILAIVFVQNREPIALKLLCADLNQSCVYQTPQLPLAVWIALATLTGAIANLLVQTLNQSGYRGSRKRQKMDSVLYSKPHKRQKESDKYTVSSEDPDNYVDGEQFTDITSFEAEQAPQNVERSGSNYSYKYREAGDRLTKDSDKTKSTPSDREFKRNGAKESDEEEWI